MKAEDPVAQSHQPLVSICIPTFNGARWIPESLTSALAQSYQPIEILVIDDASTDGTRDLVESLKDERIRKVVNERNEGMVNNWNKCVELARGEFIKFLFQDDVLYPDCVEKLMRLFLSNENLELTFSPREIFLEGDVRDRRTRTWLEKSSMLHSRFNSLETVNNGRELFAQYLRKRFQGNWIGEPSSVLVRKECFSRVGLFNEKLYQVL